MASSKEDFGGFPFAIGECYPTDFGRRAEAALGRSCEHARLTPLSLLDTLPSQKVQVLLVIPIVSKDRFALVAAGDDVMDRAAALEPQRPAHAARRMTPDCREPSARGKRVYGRRINQLPPGALTPIRPKLQVCMPDTASSFPVRLLRVGQDHRRRERVALGSVGLALPSWPTLPRRRFRPPQLEYDEPRTLGAELSHDSSSELPPPADEAGVLPKLPPEMPPLLDSPDPYLQVPSFAIRRRKELAC